MTLFNDFSGVSPGVCDRQPCLLSYLSRVADDPRGSYLTDEKIVIQLLNSDFRFRNVRIAWLKIMKRIETRYRMYRLIYDTRVFMRVRGTCECVCVCSHDGSTPFSSISKMKNSVIKTDVNNEYKASDSTKSIQFNTNRKNFNLTNRQKVRRQKITGTLDSSFDSEASTTWVITYIMTHTQLSY